MLDRTLFDYVTCGHDNFRTGLLKLVLLLQWTGSVTPDVNTLPTHCIVNGQGSAAECNNIGQLMSTLLHYSELKLLHSGDIQPNPGPVSSESQGHASVLACDMPRGLKIGEWNVQSQYNKIEQNLMFSMPGAITYTSWVSPKHG